MRVCQSHESVGAAYEVSQKCKLVYVHVFMGGGGGGGGSGGEVRMGLLLLLLFACTSLHTPMNLLNTDLAQGLQPGFVLP